MTGFRFPPHARRFLLWGARLAFLAYLVQIVAIDHWHTHPTDDYGVAGTSAHVAHCHGAGDCSDGSGAIASPALTEQTTLRLPATVTALTLLETDTAPVAAFAETLLQPPRAA